jgi:hypothetical protein
MAICLLDGEPQRAKERFVEQGMRKGSNGHEAAELKHFESLI